LCYIEQDNITSDIFGIFFDTYCLIKCRESESRCSLKLVTSLARAGVSMAMFCSIDAYTAELVEHSYIHFEELLV